VVGSDAAGVYRQVCLIQSSIDRYRPAVWRQNVVLSPSLPLTIGLCAYVISRLICNLQSSQVERHELVPGVAQGGPPSIAANTAKVGRAESEDEVADSVAGQDGG
jgi:hypothetical protein